MRVSEVMNRNVVSVTSSDTVADVAKKMGESDLRCVPIFENGRTLGMIWDRDIITKILAKDIQPSMCHVSVLTSPPSSQLTIAPDADVFDAARIMTENGQQCLCVVNGTKLIGLVSREELANSSEVVGEVMLRKLTAGSRESGAPIERSSRAG